MKIAVLVSFLAVLVVFFFVAQVPITLTSDEVAKAVSEATAESGMAVDEELLEQALQLSVAKLEKGATHAPEISRLRLPHHLVGICPLCIATRNANSKNSTNASPSSNKNLTTHRRILTLPKNHPVVNHHNLQTFPNR